MDDQPVKSLTNWLAGVSFVVFSIGLVLCAAYLLWRVMGGGHEAHPHTKKAGHNGPAPEVYLHQQGDA